MLNLSVYTLSKTLNLMHFILFNGKSLMCDTYTKFFTGTLILDRNMKFSFIHSDFKLKY